MHCIINLIVSCCLLSHTRQYSYSIRGTSNNSSNNLDTIKNVNNSLSQLSMRKLVKKDGGNVERICSSGKAKCHVYIQRMIAFYKKVGAWVLLAVSFLGISSLIGSFFHGRYLSRKYILYNLGGSHKWSFRRDMLFNNNYRQQQIPHASSNHNYRNGPVQETRNILLDSAQ